MSRPATRPTEAARRIRGRGTDGRFELELLFLASGAHLPHLRWVMSRKKSFHARMRSMCVLWEEELFR